jgi:hypothetical protein
MTCPRILAIFVAFSILLTSVQIDLNLPTNLQLPDSPITTGDELKAQQLTGSIATSEWLGPMAPIALSPFFGITCLSGMSVFGESVMGEGSFLTQNQFVSSNPVLNQQAVFWIFLILTVVTSLPRLTKVSKPIAQVLDQVETYAGIITIIVIRMVASSGGAETATAFAEPEVIQMGFMSFTGDMLLVVAAAINIFVINLVKFFFEALIWLTPIPAVDAIFEACNKALCAAMMAIYAWSPLVATILNLILFTLCAIVFRRIYREVTYMRTMLADPVWKLINKAYGDFGSKKEMVVFPKGSFGPFPAKSKLLMTRTETGWKFIRKSLPLFPSKVLELSDADTTVDVEGGFLLNKLVVEGEPAGQLIFSRRYSGQLDTVANQMGFRPPESESSAAEPAIA